MTRITYGMISKDVQSGIQTNGVKLDDLMAKLSSGKLLNQPSDDSVAVSKVLKLHSQSSRQDQYVRNIQDGQMWLATSETALTSGNDVLQRANELAIQGANGTYSATERAYSNTEIRQLADQMMSIANTSLKGDYLFAGTQTDTPPYSLQNGTDSIKDIPNANGTGLTAVPATIQLYDTAARDSNTTTGNPAARDILPGTLDIKGLTEGTDFKVDYKSGQVTFLTTTAENLAAGTGINISYDWIRRSEKDMTGSVNREIQKNTAVPVNVTPDQAFGTASGISVFDSLVDLMQGLHTNDSTKVKSSMPEIQDSLQRLLQAQTMAGSRANRLTSTQTQNAQDSLALTDQTSQLEDVDFTKTISDFQTRQQVYQASLQVGAKIIQPSLANFL